MLVKIHESYRKIVAICDKELLGKRFVEGKTQIYVKEDFYKGEEKNEEETIRILKQAQADDATFNFVGEQSTQTGIKAGVIDEKGILHIQGIPHALSLL